MFAKFMRQVIYICSYKINVVGYHWAGFCGSPRYVNVNVNSCRSLIIASEGSGAGGEGGQSSCGHAGVLGFSLAFLGLFEKKLPVEEEIVMYIKKAILATQREEYDLAEQNLDFAFHYSRKHCLQEALSQVVALQANLAFNRGKFDRAERLFNFLAQRIINLQQATLTDNAFVEISIKLAEIYAKSERIDQAISGFLYCIKTQKEKIDSGAEDEDTLLLCAWALQSLAQLYFRLASPGNENDPHLTVAIKCLNEAYSYVSKTIGSDAEQALGIQTDLATALALQGDLNGALKINKELQALAKDFHADMVPQIHINIAHLHLQKSEFEEAKKLCIEAKHLGTKLKDMELVQRAEECIIKSVNGKRKLEAKA